MASNGYTAGSLDMPSGEDADDNDRALADRIGDIDPAMEGVENLVALKPLIAALPERDRQILDMRFVQEMTQSQIGAAFGVSQMHISRLLNRTLTHLRHHLTATA